MRIVFYFFTCASLLFSSCKEDNYRWNIYLENKSNQEVHVKLTSRMDSTSKSTYLKPNEEVFIQTQSRRGKSVSSYALEVRDGLLVYDTCFEIFNDTVALVYTYDEFSERNILFTRNYTQSAGSGSSLENANENYRYTINEQDFLNAEPL